MSYRGKKKNEGLVFLIKERKMVVVVRLRRGKEGN